MHIDEATLFNDTKESDDNGAINQESLDEGIDDVTIPLLDKVTEKKDKKSKRIREGDKLKGSKKSNKEKVNKSKKEKIEDKCSNKEHNITETTPIDMQEQVERKEEETDKDRRKEKGAKRRSKGKANSNS